MENVAYKKTKWVNTFRRSHSKRHVGQSGWLRATPPRDVTSGTDVDGHVTECVQLSSLYVDRPTMRVDLGRRMDVSGVIIAGQKHTDGTYVELASEECVPAIKANSSNSTRCITSRRDVT